MSNEHPDMSGAYPEDDYYSYEQMLEKQHEAFVAGAQQMREMLARFVEQGGDSPATVIAQSMRANWVPGWGKDPGKPDDVHGNIDAALP
jgi:hypothetical protein